MESYYKEKSPSEEEYAQLISKDNASNQNIVHCVDVNKFFKEHAAMFAPEKSNIEFLKSRQEVQKDQNLYFYEVVHRLKYFETNPNTESNYCYTFDEICQAKEI